MELTLLKTARFWSLVGTDTGSVFLMSTTGLASPGSELHTYASDICDGTPRIVPSTYGSLVHCVEPTDARWDGRGDGEMFADTMLTYDVVLHRVGFKSGTEKVTAVVGFDLKEGQWIFQV